MIRAASNGIGWAPGLKAAFGTERALGALHAESFQSIYAYTLHQRLQHRNAFAEPSQLFARDLVLSAISGVHVGSSQQFETPLLEFGRSRPSSSEPRIELFGL